jgi:PAS domain S-box-containing protein
MRLKFVILLCVFLSAGFFSIAGNEVDSLEQVLKQVSGDEKFELLITLSKKYWYTNPDKSIEYCNNALSLAEEQNDNKKIARAYNRIGNGYYFKNENEKAISFYEKSLELSDEIGYYKGVARASNNMGLIYQMLGDYEKSIESYYISLKSENKIGDKFGIADSYNNLANVYYRLDDFDKALKLYLKNLEVYAEIDAKPGILSCYTNIGSVYSEKMQFDKAEEYLLKAYDLSVEINNIDMQAANINNLGKVYYRKKEYRRALDFYYRALKINELMDDKWSYSNTLQNIGLVYIDQGRLNSAFNSFRKALSVSKKYGMKNLTMTLYDDISGYYEKVGDYKSALKYHKLYSEINDSIYNEDTRSQIAEIENKYQFQHKEQQLKLYEKENEVQSLQIKTQRYVIYSVVSFSILILVLVILFYYRSHINKKARMVLEEKNTKITEQKILLEKAVSELRESEEKQKSLISNILDGIFIIQNNRLLYVNEAGQQISGYSFYELQEVNFQDIIHPDDQAFVVDNHRKRLRGEKVSNSYQFRLIHKNGNIVNVLISAGAISYHGQKAILGTLKDITNQKKYEDALIHEKKQAEQATKSKSMFLAGMSHEIRNHLNSIIGIADVLKETELTDEQMEYLNIIDVSGNNLLNIINEILDFSKIESGHVILEKEEFSISKVVKDVIALHEINAKKINLYLKADISKEINDMVIGDPVRVSQVLINLVSNALKFTDNGGITIKIVPDIRQESRKAKNDIALKFMVIDTGIGISKDSQNKLFKPFSQTHAAVERKKGGTGLGLVISMRLVEMMQGKIGIVSDVGKGSTFWFTAKFQISNTQLLKGEPGANTTLTNNRIKILLVEDNVLNQHLTTSILTKGGYKTDVAENGKIGLDLYKKNIYNIVLMDIQMPVMDGIEATRMIRKFEKTVAGNNRRAKIIAVTAHTKEGEKQQFFEAGMDLYLSKPFKSSDLIDLIKKIEDS